MTVPSWIPTALRLAKQWPAPATVIVLAGAYALIWWTYHDTARADELATLKEEVATLKTDVKDLAEDVSQGRLDTLEGQLFEARVSQCKAAGDELRRVYAQRVAKLQATYAEAGGDRFDLPDCDDL